VVDRVAEYADGWLPIGGRAGGASIADLRAACARRGRRFEDITLAFFYAPLEEAAARARIAEGYSHLVYALPSASRDEVLPALDRVAALARRLNS
jgi:hypothetical protein